MQTVQPIFLYFPRNLDQYGKIFLSSYQLQKIIFSDAEKGRELKPKSSRICRFCKKHSGEVTFKQIAHAIPELLGNKRMLSDFECDECNEKFGRMDNELAIYAAPMLAMQGTRGKEGRRTLTSKGNKIIIPFVFEGIELTLITQPNNEDDSMNYNNETGTNTFRFSKNRYIPIKVYKAFLKSALSCLSEDEFKYYSHAVKFLMSETWDENNLDFAKINLHSVPMGNEQHGPVIFIYKRIDPEAKIPTHIFIIRFANCYAQFMLPFHDIDMVKIYNRDIEYPVCPPVFSTPSGDISLTFFNTDLRSFEKQAAEEVQLSFDTDPNYLKKNAGVYDPQTNLVKPLNAFEKMVSAVMAPTNTQFTYEQLSRLSKVIEELKAKNMN